MVSRSTSKMEDVNGIQANTLDLSASEVIALPSEQRMKAILKAQQRLPAALIFNDARKVTDPHSRWVPLYPESSRLSIEGPPATLKPSATGFYLDTVNATPVGFLVDPSVPRYPRIRLVDPSSPNDIDIPATVYLLGNLRGPLQGRSVTRGSQGARFALVKKEDKMLHLVYEYSFFYSHQRKRQFSESEETYTTVYAMGRTEEEAEFHIDCGTSVVVFVILISFLRTRRSSHLADAVVPPRYILKALIARDPDLMHPLWDYLVDDNNFLICDGVATIRSEITVAADARDAEAQLQKGN
ncbi:MAG: hypothetical protein Q9182_003875 [Xanthomendoza sp. 2 TL-2023]